MAREVLNSHAKFEILGDAWMFDVEASVTERMRHRVARPPPLEMAHQTGESLQRFWIEAERLSYFAGGGLAAIGDDIGADRGSEFSVALVDVLDCLFTHTFGGKIQIDVWPFSPALAQEALEQKFHANRIDGRNFKGVAHGRIRGTASSLDQDVVTLAELHDVPDDEEVPGEAQSCNQSKLMLDLFFGPFEQTSIALRPIAPNDPLIHALAQEAVHRLPVRYGIPGKLIAEITQFKAQARGKFC